MSGNIYLYIAIMAAVTYLIRLIPLTILRREINNITIKSFLYYVPYITLAVMTFPAILGATNSLWSGLAGFIAALVLAYCGQSLFRVSLLACFTVFIVEFFI